MSNAFARRLVWFICIFICAAVIFVLARSLMDMRRVAFDDDTFTRMFDRESLGDGPGFDDADAIRRRIDEHIRTQPSQLQLIVGAGPNRAVVIERTESKNHWVPRGFIWTAMPVRDDFEDEQAYRAACADYHAAQWLFMQPKPWNLSYICPRSVGGSWEVADHQWRFEIGMAQVADVGLHVTVDVNGRLVDIQPTFSPE